MTELFRSGTLYQPAAPDQVAKNLRLYREKRQALVDTANQYSNFYAASNLSEDNLVTTTEKKIGSATAGAVESSSAEVADDTSTQQETAKLYRSVLVFILYG